MVFSSTVFLFLFLPAVLVIYFNPFIKSRIFRNVFLLLASIGFYAWGEPLFVFVMLLSIFVNWWFGRCLEKSLTTRRKKQVLVLAIIYNIGLLFIFKYLTFLAKNFGILLDKDLSFIKITLPIGISFFTFQMLSYVFDVYYGKATSQHSIINVGLYVSMFPQLIAGPIVRYETVAVEITDRRENWDDFTSGMVRFIYGLGKKVLIANYMAVIADKIFGMDRPLSVTMAWLGAISYTFQIYFDFSGYSDMAIGLGRMFGFHFPENFNYPYIAASITDFWHRWHISLSTWFRDYIYIPLGGNRVKKGRWIWNLFVVWALTGIWHGANWTFLFWGLFYFVFLLIEKLTNFPEKLKWFSHIYTMLIVVIAWVIFRSDTIISAFQYIGYLFGIHANGFSDALSHLYLSNGAVPLLIAAILFSTPLFSTLYRQIKDPGWQKDLIQAVCVFTVFVVSVLVCVKSTYNPFIYFNF